MIEIALCSLDDLEPTPWKNGGGTTCELLVYPEQGEFEWRLSLATIQHDGAFSTFDGLDRLFVPITGEPFALTHGDACPQTSQRVGEVHRFDGEWPTRAESVIGEVCVLNVMTRRGRWRATVEWLGARPARFALESEHSVLLVVKGSASGRVSGEEDPVELGPRTALWLSEPERGDELILDETNGGFAAVLVELRSA